MPSDLWRYSINAIKSDINISKLRDYQAKEVKKTILDGLDKLNKIHREKISKNRIEKFSKMGIYKD